MTESSNRDVGAVSRLANTLKRTLQPTDRVILRLVTSTGAQTITAWEPGTIDDPTKWAEECSDAAQDDADSAAATSNYEVVIEREGRAVATQRMRRVPKLAPDEPDRTPLVTVVKILTGHVESLTKSVVTMATSPNQPLVAVVDAMTKRVLDLEGRRAEAVDEVSRSRFLVDEMVRSMKDDEGIEIDDAMMGRLEKIANRAFDAWELHSEMKKAEFAGKKG